MRPAAGRLSWYVGGVLFVFVTCALVLLVGQADLPRGRVLVEAFDRLTPGTIESGLEPIQKSIVWNLRLPRIVLGLTVGAALATAGATFQGVFRNPLADPYFLGVAAGGGFGATIAFVNDWGDGRGLLDGVQVAAFIGALVAVALTWTLGAIGDRRQSTTTLILAGVAVASFFTALQTYLQQRNTEDIREIYVWFLGGLTTQGWSEVIQSAPLALVCIGLLLLAGRTLDVLGVGDDEAGMLGLSVVRTRLLLIVIAALLTATAVAVSGLIAFVGLIVPHTVRLIFGHSYRVVLPMSVLIGASFLVLCDVAARTVGNASEIPIGVVTAFFGAPFFVVILRTANR
ncbi:MAG: iron ABC transporter permease [Actinomycetota bacterium]